MITAIFNPSDKSITTKKVMQWDYGQVLSIKGLDLPKAVEIHFCVYTDTTTITTVGITTDDHTDVEIPDGLLRQDRELRAYVYVADLEQGKTVRTVNIPIQSRQKPEIPHTPEDAEIFREAIKAVNDSADRAETAADTSEKNAKKTAEDRVAIEEMVETVSGIEQQVQDVKKYAGQAETAASNAALSEQEAKKSENAALQAKADTETAKGSAETAAGKTAEDKTAVERAKEEVLQAKQQVSADRAAVEEVERNVTQMGNTIPQAVQAGVQTVESAGIAQKSAVESAGTKAVEDITLVKKSATDAVETAKTGAVQAVQTEGTTQTGVVTAEGEKQVKAIADKGAEVLQSIPEDFTVQMGNKLDKQQGIENKGKALVVGEDGNVIPGEVTGGASSWKLVSTITLTQPTNDIVFRDNIVDYDSFFLIFEGSVSVEGSLRFNTGFNFGTGTFIVNNLVLKQNTIPGSTHKWWFNINKLEHSVFYALYQANGNEGISAFIYKFEPNIQNFFVRALAGKPYATGSVFKLYGRETA